MRAIYLTLAVLIIFVLMASACGSGGNQPYQGDSLDNGSGDGGGAQPPANGGDGGDNGGGDGGGGDGGDGDGGDGVPPPPPGGGGGGGLPTPPPPPIFD